MLALFFLDPLIVYLPGDIDHHNAQIALTMATVAFALRIGSGARFGFLAGLTSALTLAIGLEMLPHVVVIGAAIALQWAVTGKNGRAIAAYGATLAVMPADLYALAGSPAASWPATSLSFAYTVPLAVAGFGLAGLGYFGERLPGVAARLGGLIVIGAVAAGIFVLMSPGCLGGPYGFLSPELKKVWLQHGDRGAAVPGLCSARAGRRLRLADAALLAVAVAVFHLRPGAGEKRSAWAVPAALLVMATALSFYQIRTLPFASAVTIPILGAWIAEMRARSIARTKSVFWRALPVASAFLAAVQVTYLLIGLQAVDLLAYLSDGRIAPREAPKPPEELVKGLTEAQKNCFDPASASPLRGSAARGS